MSTTSIHVKVQNEEGDIRRFSTDPSFAALKACLASRFDPNQGNILKVTYKDESDDDVCLSNDEDLQTALEITGAANGAKPLRLKVMARRQDLVETPALENLRISELGGASNALPLKKQFKQMVKSDPSLLELMQDPALGAQDKARALPSPELQQWFLDNQHVVYEKLAKLQMKQDCAGFGRPCFGKGKGGGKCGKGKGKGKGAWDGKGGKGGRVEHATQRLHHVLSTNPDVAQQLIAAPESLEPLLPFPRLHQFCLNHPAVLHEQLEQLGDAVNSASEPWVPMRHRIIRYLSNHDESRGALRRDGSAASLDAVMANKPGMLRYLQSNLAELPLLLDEADAMRATRPAVGTKRPSGDEKKEKKLAEQQQKKAKKLEHKQLKVRMKVVRFLTKRPRDLEALRADPSATTAAKIFHGKPKLKDYLTTHADAIAQFVDEAVLLRGDEDPTSSSSSDERDVMDEDAVVIAPGNAA